MVSSIHGNGFDGGFDGFNGLEGIPGLQGLDGIGDLSAPAPLRPAVARTGNAVGSPLAGATERYAEEQRFEEEVRAALTLLRPHRRERLLGWSQYSTGGAHFRATISWDPDLSGSPGATEADAALDEQLSVPRLTDVLESILVGSVKNQDELHAAEEFEIYRGVVRELHRRLDEMQSCYE